MHKKGNRNRERNKMKEVEIYTDGACSGNPGVGGWAAILIYGPHEKKLAGVEEDTTNNRMEMTAAVEGLKGLKEACKVKLYSDSSYLVSGFLKGWVETWKKNGWITSSKDEVKNIELWKELDRLNSYHEIKWIKVKGHSDNEYNNMCDKLAVEQIKKYKKMPSKEV
jgi:ribonuclease HI